MGAQFIPDRVSDLSDWLQSSFVDASVVAWDAAAGRFRAAVEGVSYISPQVNHADPTWISSLAGSKVAGNIPGNAASITGAVPTAQVTGLDAALAGKAATVHYHYAADITAGTLDPARLPNTAVTPGSYTLSSITVDSTGRITAAASGTAGGGGTPGGTTGQVQYNNAGAFGGAEGVNYAASGSIVTVQARAVADVPIVAKGFSTGQTGNLIEARDVNNAVQASVSPAGEGRFGISSGFAIAVGGNGSVGGYLYGTGRGQGFAFPSSYDVIPTFSGTVSDNAIAWGRATYRWSSVFGAQIQALGATSTLTPLIARGAAGQTGNLQEWQDSTGAVLSSVSENGYHTTRKIAEPADAELANSEVAYWLDPTPGAAKFNIKAKTSAGVVVRGSMALS